MHLSERHPSATPDDANDAHHADEHYQPLKNAIPAWLGDTSATRRAALKNSVAQQSATLKTAPAEQHALMKSLGAAHITAQSQVDKSLEHLQDAAAFAEPLLKAELKRSFDLDVDVRNTYVRLYIPATTPWFPIRTGARAWSVSLLEAALHNFEDRETEDDAFEAESTFTSAPSATGQFETLPDIKARLSIPAFTKLCRRLDIGAKYKASLEDNLGYSDPMVASVLRGKIDASQKAAMKSALQWARMNRDVSENAVRLIEAMLDGMKGLHVHGAPLLCHDMTMLCAPLTGILVFAPDLYMTRNAARVVAYVPDDPEHPFKEYASPLEMVVELTRQLRSREYQQFFSRFVNHDQRGFFFSTLNSRLSEIRWHPHEPGDPRPAWREAAVERPDLQTALTPFHDDLWQHLYRAKLNKIFNDARTIAVPTALVDQRARWAFWDSVVNIISSIAQTAAMIVAPFVPVLGEAMMAYMAYQMLDEVFEGIVEWAQGRTTEAVEHLMGTVESMIQLGMFAVGGAIGAAEFRKVLPKEIVAFIDRFKPVRLANGETRYWQPDLERYKHPQSPIADSQPDALGLHTHQDKLLLPLEDAHFAVKESSAPGQYRIEHPSRPDAYQPLLRHNGEGAWHTELEQPLQWDGATALRRIGPSVESLSSNERATVLRISGTSEDALRKMHVEQEKVPPLLADSIQRFKIDQQLQRFIDQLDSDVAEEFLRADPFTQLQVLSEYGRWPGDKCLRLLDRQGEQLWQSSADASLPVIELRQDRLVGGDVLKTLLYTLDETQIRALLDEPFAGPTPSIEVRGQNLRKQVADLARRNRSALFESRYQALQQLDDPLAARLKMHPPELPASVTRELLDTATGSELLQISEGQLPARQQALMQMASAEVRVTRAYEGLELGSVNNTDSDSLALHSLKLLPGWSGDVRIEIRDGRYEGPLLDTIGRDDAPAHKVLVRRDDGQYQPCDDRGQQLHSFTDFYSSLLYALPDSERQSLDLRIGQSQALKAAIRERTLERNEWRQVIADTPSRAPTVDTLRLLGTDGYAHAPRPPRPAYQPHTLEEDIRVLYPRMSNHEMRFLAESMRRSPAGPRAEMLRLQNDYLQLQNELHVWANNPPAVHPETGTALTPLEKRAELQNRRLLREQLLKAWRREHVTGINQQGFAAGYALRLTPAVMGDLPVLSANFSHITSLAIDGSPMTTSVDSFLQSFSQLQNIDARNLNLPSLPQALTSMPSLRELRLRDCRVSLTTVTESVLASLPQLTLLDLQGNALGLPPDVRTMPSLRYVNLSDTGIHTVPDDLLDHPRLISAQFDRNRITRIPEKFFNLASSLSDGYTFADNPLTAASRERVKVFYEHTGKHFGVRPVQEDLQRTIALFPSLDTEGATRVLYGLPGPLAECGAQLSRWENELGVLHLELNQWINQAAVTAAQSGERLPLEAQTRELDARRDFARQIEQFWRSPPTTYPRLEELRATATFSGDMPILSIGFERVTRLNLVGNANITAALRFVECFPNLAKLKMNGFELEPLALGEAKLPRLTDLELKNCGVIMTPENQAALLSLNALDTLDLSNNPLGTFPDLNLLPELFHLDLSNCGLTVVPEGLTSHPGLRTAVLSGNRITQLPDALFDLAADRSDGIDLADNPLSAATRDQVKNYYRIHGNDFDVMAAEPDVALARQLFPGLNNQEASEMIYDLPGDLADGRKQLLRWQVEQQQMRDDLTRWALATPSTHPGTGQVLNASELLAQRSARSDFKQLIEDFWSERLMGTGERRASLAADLKFFGEMPRLTVNFDHVTSLKLAGNVTTAGLEPFAGLFPNLQTLELKAFTLYDIPSFVSRLHYLKELTLNDCALTLTPAGQQILGALPELRLLDLSHNPLTNAPDLTIFPKVSHFWLGHTDLISVPEGIAEHPLLQELHLNNNQITELPDAFFNLNPDRANSVYLNDNPLSMNARERVKRYYAAQGRNFRIKPASADIAMAQRLFPRLGENAAINMIYRLPGTLQTGTAQLVRWEAEIARMTSDLNTWSARLPVNNPSTALPWTAPEKFAELAARQRFSNDLEKLWRGRQNENSALRFNTFEANAPFAGELPELTADFSHITHLNLQGNPGLNIPDGFFRSFSGLRGLELQGFALGRMPQTLQSLPLLERLMLSKCQITLDPAGQAILSTLTRLKWLDLYSNALQATPDVSSMQNLTFIDLINTGIDSVPAGLEQLPHLEVALLSDNNISELPAQLTLYCDRGIELGANPLSVASRERIKAVFQARADNFGVWVQQDDIELAQDLYPSLSGFDANDLLYGLPGTLADGRLELMRRKTELTSLLERLGSWVNEIPSDPVTQMPLGDGAAATEKLGRQHFRHSLENDLRRAPTFLTGPRVTCELSFTGELPPLAARFDHIEQLKLTTTASAPPRIDRLLALFPKLKGVDIRNYPLGEIPSPIFVMDRLRSLYLPDCGITLTAPAAEAFAALKNLRSVDLSDNPLNNAPDLSHFPQMTDVRLGNCALSKVPDGLLELPRLMYADLSENAITELPGEFPSQPGEVVTEYDFSDNPLTADSQQRLERYDAAYQTRMVEQQSSNNTVYQTIEDFHDFSASMEID
ncbi:hypothetical protein GXB78_11440 [Pseudomonas moraviensis subsp. stanleyae]|uniref:dermonecrotic toxin domain-containing protein n=1 Tax=Pseudomonas moraviensis TaxID=321662 RepID=UPI002E33C40A|nr:DUF6543 domain-containing protein [Pseudomonas moraviensis]MED7667808.1 hypothetical protein [Pseudomonas moraviensis subsp. stanleyae]